MELINKTTLKTNNVRASSISALNVPFHMLITTILSLLLPLSYLLLARFSTAHYLLSVSENYLISHPTNSFLYSIFLYTNYSKVVHLLVAIISVSSLTHVLTGEIPFLPQEVTKPRLSIACTFLFLIEVLTGLGLEGSIAAGIDGSGFVTECSIPRKVAFFLGLHETTMFWRSSIVKIVVDDTMFGFSRKEGVLERVVMGLSYLLWMCRLREELEPLVVVPEVKRELMMRIGVADLAGWWLYYLTVTVGMVKVIKGLVLFVRVMSRRRGVEVVVVDDDDNC